MDSNQIDEYIKNQRILMLFSKLNSLYLDLIDSKRKWNKLAFLLLIKIYISGCRNSSRSHIFKIILA